MKHTPLHPDDFKVGQLITIYDYKARPYLCPQCNESYNIAPPNNEFCGEPFKITAICLPYLAVTYLGNKYGAPGTFTRLDTRFANFMEVSSAYVKGIGGVIDTKVKEEKITIKMEPEASPTHSEIYTLDKILDAIYGKQKEDIKQNNSSTPEPPKTNDKPTI